MNDEPEKRILVIEDDAHIAEGLRLNLSLQGYAVRVAATGQDGLTQWKLFEPDLIVLDIMLPGIDGLAVLESIRLEDEKLPILILSAKADSEDKIKGLSLGVDDYLTKPFQLEEFLLRVKRLIRRYDWIHKAETQSSIRAVGSLTSYTFGQNRIDFDSLSATGPKGCIQLTEQEIKLLKLFIAHKGQVLSRSRLLEIGWGYDRRVSSRTIDNFVLRLRKYFEEDPKTPQYFKSIRAIGYLFDHSD
jgi:DNA-binding response OmpR family regulator